MHEKLVARRDQQRSLGALASPIAADPNAAITSPSMISHTHHVQEILFKNSSETLYPPSKQDIKRQSLDLEVQKNYGASHVISNVKASNTLQINSSFGKKD